MTTQAWIVLTSAQATTAISLNDSNTAVDPRAVDNSLANNLGYGTLVGQYVLPARLLNDPDYSRWIDTLGNLPIHVMDSDTLFAPSNDG